MFAINVIAVECGPDDLGDLRIRESVAPCPAKSTKATESSGTESGYVKHTVAHFRSAVKHQGQIFIVQGS